MCTLAELAAHGIDGGLVGGLLVARARASRAAAMAAASVTRATSSIRTRSSPALLHSLVCHGRFSLAARCGLTAARCGSSAAAPTHCRRCSMASSASRIASSVVSCVISMTARARRAYSRAPMPGCAPRGRRCTMLSSETSRSPMRLAIAAIARPVEDGQPHVVAALVLPELGALVRLQLAAGTPNGGSASPARDVEDVAGDRGRGRMRAGARPDEQQIARRSRPSIATALVTPDTSAIAECFGTIADARAARCRSRSCSATPSSLMR